ncbi:MAG: hypothetical protein K1X79_11925 [Oligoflexia bacterium]|nr:hypothetical protein [Oligoflexia bacterium]
MSLKSCQIRSPKGAVHFIGLGVLILLVCGVWLMLVTYGRVGRVDEENTELRHRMDLLELRVKNLELRR